MRRYAEAKLDMAAYYHIRDCFVDPADFDWMSPGGRRFMAHWWNTMPQYSALFDHHGRVRPAWYAFRLLNQLDGTRYAVEGEQGNLRAIAGDGNGYKHLIVWRYEDGGPDEIEVRLDLAGVSGRSTRVVKLDAAAPSTTSRSSALAARTTSAACPCGSSHGTFDGLKSNNYLDGIHFYLNGIRCNLRGESPSYGEKADLFSTRDTSMEMIRRYQAANCNVLRFHSMPAPPHVLDVCDELGMLE